MCFMIFIMLFVIIGLLEEEHLPKRPIGALIFFSGFSIALVLVCTLHFWKGRASKRKVAPALRTEENAIP